MNSLTQFALLFEPVLKSPPSSLLSFQCMGEKLRFPLEAENSDITSVSQLGDVQQAVHHLKKMRKKLFPSSERKH